MSNLHRTDDRKLCLIVQGMLDGLTINEIAEIAGSKPTAYRYMNVLEQVYDVEIALTKGSYTIASVGNDNIWRKVFKELF